MIERRAPERHGLSGSSEYRIWSQMVSRCHDPKSTNYPRYGAKGVTVCSDWRASFLAFFEHVGRRPSPKHSIDRIRNERGYEPGNVRWATAKEQARNRTTNVFLTAFGRTQCIVDWSKELGIAPGSLCYRLSRGLALEQIVANARPTPRRGPPDFSPVSGGPTCRAGKHAAVPANIYTHPTDGHVICRACRAEGLRRHKAAAR